MAQLIKIRVIKLFSKIEKQSGKPCRLGVLVVVLALTTVRDWSW